jgi:hypothetical protein
LTLLEHKANIPAWTVAIASLFTPSSLSGSPAASARGAGPIVSLDWPKFGPEISLRDLTDRFSYDCMWRAEAHGRKGNSGCGVYLPDLDSRGRQTRRRGW